MTANGGGGFTTTFRRVPSIPGASRSAYGAVPASRPDRKPYETFAAFARATPRPGGSAGAPAAPPLAASLVSSERLDARLPREGPEDAAPAITFAGGGPGASLSAGQLARGIACIALGPPGGLNRGAFAAFAATNRAYSSAATSSSRTTAASANGRMSFFRVSDAEISVSARVVRARSDGARSAPPPRWIFCASSARAGAAPSTPAPSFVRVCSVVLASPASFARAAVSASCACVRAKDTARVVRPSRCVLFAACGELRGTWEKRFAVSSAFARAFRTRRVSSAEPSRARTLRALRLTGVFFACVAGAGWRRERGGSGSVGREKRLGGKNQQREARVRRASGCAARSARRRARTSANAPSSSPPPPRFSTWVPSSRSRLARALLARPASQSTTVRLS